MLAGPAKPGETPSGSAPRSSAMSGTVGAAVLNESAISLNNTGSRCPQRAARVRRGVNLSPEILGVAGQACCPAGSEARGSGEHDRVGKTQQRSGGDPDHSNGLHSYGRLKCLIDPGSRCTLSASAPLPSVELWRDRRRQRLHCARSARRQAPNTSPKRTQALPSHFCN